MTGPSGSGGGPEPNASGWKPGLVVVVAGAVALLLIAATGVLFAAKGLDPASAAGLVVIAVGLALGIVVFAVFAEASARSDVHAYADEGSPARLAPLFVLAVLAIGAILLLAPSYAPTRPAATPGASASPGGSAAQAASPQQSPAGGSPSVSPTAGSPTEYAAPAGGSCSVPSPAASTEPAVARSSPRASPCE